MYSVVATNNIFEQPQTTWILTDLGWEEFGSDVSISIENGWVNILTGIVTNILAPNSGYDVVLDISMYNDILTDEEYNEIIE